jgi:hypothetical protein
MYAVRGCPTIHSNKVPQRRSGSGIADGGYLAISRHHAAILPLRKMSRRYLFASFDISRRPSVCTHRLEYSSMMLQLYILQ